MRRNFKAWSVVDREGNFVVAILVAPDFVGLPEITDQFRRLAGGHPRLVAGIPRDRWVRWIDDQWKLRTGVPSQATGGGDV